jgi:hypothetical protein
VVTGGRHRLTLPSVSPKFDDNAQASVDGCFLCDLKLVANLHNDMQVCVLQHAFFCDGILFRASRDLQYYFVIMAIRSSIGVGSDICILCDEMP